MKSFRKLLHPLLFSVALALSNGPLLFAASSAYVIDTPTTGILDYGSYDLGFRLFSNGGELTRLNFGVFKMVNLGLGWEVSNVIGSQNIVVGPPAIYLKIRPYPGGMILPSMAIGYDGQGYFYNKDQKEFTEKEKGIFVVFGRELFVPGLELNFGANMNDFGTNRVFGFASTSFSIEEKFALLAEYDNVNYFPDARINAGFRVGVTEGLHIELAGRDIGSSRSAERVIQIKYVGEF